MGFASFLSHEGIQENAKVGGCFFGLAPIQEFAKAFVGIFHGKKSPAVVPDSFRVIKSSKC